MARPRTPIDKRLAEAAPTQHRAHWCMCGHHRDEHQFQGFTANWPCNHGAQDTDPDPWCGCNWFTPRNGQDPYRSMYARDQNEYLKAGLGVKD